MDEVVVIGYGAVKKKDLTGSVSAIKGDDLVARQTTTLSTALQGSVSGLLVTRDSRLVGFILIGDVDRAGIYTSLIREQTPLDTIDFELIRDKPQLMAFSHAERAKKLGGAH